MMKRSPGLREFLAAPEGHYVASEHVLFWYRDPHLTGIAAWGDPTEDDARFLVQAMASKLRPTTQRHGTLVDVRFMSRAEAAPFARLAEYHVEHRERLAAVVRRCAVLCRAGVIGAVATGFFTVLKAPFPYKDMLDLREALDWLDAPDGVVAEYDHMIAAARSASPLDVLRQALREHLCDATLSRLSAVMGTSERSLQRLLQEHGTTLRDELCAARIEKAKMLLKDSGLKILGVGQAVGYKNPQHFAAVFRRALGESPAKWRATHGNVASRDRA